MTDRRNFAVTYLCYDGRIIERRFTTIRKAAKTYDWIKWNLKIIKLELSQKVGKKWVVKVEWNAQRNEGEHGQTSSGNGKAT